MSLNVHRLNKKFGAYYADCRVSTPHPDIFNEKLADELVEASRKAVCLV